MKIHVLIGATALCISQILTPAAAGGIYKWTDPQGVVHYADRPSQVHPSQDMGKGKLPYLHIQQPIEHIKVQKRVARSVPRKPARASKGVDCSQLRRKIREIEANLRVGYTEPAGSRMRERKRLFTEQLYKHCY
jgi:hypothetical protein